MMYHVIYSRKIFFSRYILFSLPDLEHLATVGQRGKGPHDFNLLDTRSFQITPDGFHVIDANLNARKEVEIDHESLKVKSSKQIFGILLGIMSICIIGIF